MYRQTDTDRYRQAIDIQSDRKTNRHAYKSIQLDHTDRQTNRQTNM